MAIISFDILVEDLEAVLALYDRVQVWRSPDEDGSPTPYAEITAAEDEPAVVDGSAAGTWSLNGLTLSVSLSGADAVDITFDGTNPFDLQTVLDQINDAIPEFASEVPGDPETNRVRLTSPLKGTGSTILLSGSACAVLGLSTTKASGKTHRIALTSPTVTYRFRDYDGLLNGWYKTRFYSTKTKAASDFSPPRQGAPQVVLSDALMSVATVDLIDGSGKPIVNRRVIFVPMGVQVIVDGDTNFGLLASVERLVATTNERGHASISLARGHTFRVFFEGSGYHREFVVPDTATFDLLTVLSTSPDPFSIVQVPPSPIRNS